MKKKGYKFQNRLLFYSIGIILSFLLLSAQEEAQIDQADSVLVDTLQVDSLFYSADSIFYSVQLEQIDLKNKAKIVYYTSTIQADTISIDIKNDQAFSKGRSILQDKDQIVLGSSIYYDLNSKWGIIDDGESKFDKGYYYGKEIRKIDDKVYDVDNGKFTTCDALHPHFYIQSKKLRLYQNDKIVVKPLVFYVNHFPVMALPFGTFTVKRGRHSGILVPSPGYNKTYGKYIRDIALYYAYKDHADFILSLDYYEKTGWETQFKADYLKRYNFNGDFTARLQKKVQTPENYRYEWLLKYHHHQNLSNKRTFDANVQFVSSTQVWEGSENIDERLNEKITSSIAYKQQLWNRNLYVNSSYTDDFKNKIKTITLPRISYSLPSKPVYELFIDEDYDIPETAWWKDFSYSYYFKATHIGDIRDPKANIWDVIYKGKKDSTGYINQHNSGIKHTGKVNYSHKFKGWFNFSQSISVNEAWFDRDLNDKKFVRGNDYSTNSSVFFSMYGMRTFPKFFLKAIRHIVTPKLSFNYKPDQSRNSRFYSFGGIGLNSSVKARSFSFSLENKLQLKFRAKEKGKEKKLNDFIKSSSRISYNLETEGKKFSNISHQISLNPGSYSNSILSMNIKPRSNITQDYYSIKFKSMDHKKWNWGITNWTFDLTTKLSFSGNADYTDYFPLQKNQFVNNKYFENDSLTIEQEKEILTLADLDNVEKGKKKWSITFNHIYKTDKQSFKIDEYSSSIRSSLTASITSNWHINYENYVNIKEKELVSHSLTLTRELHCWRIYFRYTKQRDYWSYNIRLFNIKLPDALKFKTSDHK